MIQGATASVAMSDQFNDNTYNPRHRREHRPARHRHTASDATRCRTARPRAPQKNSTTAWDARWTAHLGFAASALLPIRALLSTGCGATPVLNHYEINEAGQLIMEVDQGMPTGDNHKKQ